MKGLKSAMPREAKGKSHETQDQPEQQEFVLNLHEMPALELGGKLGDGAFSLLSTDFGMKRCHSNPEIATSALSQHHRKSPFTTQEIAAGIARSSETEHVGAQVEGVTARPGVPHVVLSSRPGDTNVILDENRASSRHNAKAKSSDGPIGTA